MEVSNENIPYMQRVGQTIRGSTIYSATKRKINNQHNIIFNMLCSCGEDFDISAAALFNKVYKEIPSHCGCKRNWKYTKFDNIYLKSYVNKQIRGITILKFLDKKINGEESSLPKFECSCACGNIFRYEANKLLNKKVQNKNVSCGCSRSKSRVEDRKYDTLTHHRFYKKYKSSAERRGLVFSLSEKQFVSIVEKPCNYCLRVTYKNAYKNIDDCIMFKSSKKNSPKEKISATHWEDVDKYTVKCSGIDRVNNDIGYTLENSVPCCTRCNVLKYTSNEDDFYSHITRVLEVKRLREEGKL